MTFKTISDQPQTFIFTYDFEDIDSLLEKVVAYELELLDYSERLLSDNPIPMDFMTAYGTLELVGTEGIELLKSLDEDDEYSGLADYKADTE